VQHAAAAAAGPCTCAQKVGICPAPTWEAKHRVLAGNRHPVDRRGAVGPHDAHIRGGWDPGPGRSPCGGNVRLKVGRLPHRAFTGCRQHHEQHECCCGHRMQPAHMELGSHHPAGGAAAGWRGRGQTTGIVRLLDGGKGVGCRKATRNALSMLKLRKWLVAQEFPVHAPVSRTDGTAGWDQKFLHGKNRQHTDAQRVQLHLAYQKSMYGGVGWPLRGLVDARAAPSCPLCVEAQPQLLAGCSLQT
jgi:hypothetical protein